MWLLLIGWYLLKRSGAFLKNSFFSEPVEIQETEKEVSQNAQDCDQKSAKVSRSTSV